MTEIEFHLENCYGIRKLKHKFNFSDSKAHLIYATNGVMKTSLALTLEDIALGKSTKDRIFSTRLNHREVKVDGRDILSDEIFVIQRMKTSEFKEVSTILANEKLKNSYDSINSKLTESKNDFLKLLQPLFGFKSNLIEKEIEVIYGQDLFKFFTTYENQINEITEPAYTNIVYAEVFNDKALKFLENKDFKSKIKEYIDVYDKLVNENNSLFVKGTFNHYNADTITKSLKDNNFFSAQHKVKIKEQEIGNVQELEELIKSEKDKVLSNPELTSIFNEIDKLLNSNAELRKFRSYVENNQEIIKEFVDLLNFRKKLILNYIALQINEFRVINNLQKDTAKQRNLIIDEAKKEQEDWKNVLEIFKRRFTVPFKVKIKNQEDVILNNEPASLLFEYTDGLGPENTMELGGPELQSCLSTGEQRVFYLLNIIFQIETKRKLDKNQLVIVDDIADSFDYKNKYAIIEYLKDVLDEPKFFMIILTHNFDFYKTIKSRLGAKINYKGNWVTIKKTSGIELEIGEKKDVFPTLRDKYDSCEFTFIACIPFVRNLLEFTIGTQNKNYIVLTSLLHLKPARLIEEIKCTNDITIQEVLEIFNNIFVQHKTKTNGACNVFDLIISKADEIIGMEEGKSFDIKLKICLSLAIRLKAEEYMLLKIKDANFHTNILSKQTGEIVEQYRRENPTELEKLGVLDRVNLMTAENIHINSFMYEPLMDLTDDHLKTLYISVKAL